MKKLFAFALAFLTLTGILTAQIESPYLEDDPYATIIKTSDIGKPRDYVKITNLSQDSDFTLEVFGYHKKDSKWQSIGKTSLSGTGSKQSFKNSQKREDGSSVSLSNYSYFAISIASGTSYDYILLEKNHDLKIFVLDSGKKNNTPSFSFDVKTYGKFKDNVKLVAGPNVRTSSIFKITAYNDKTSQDTTSIIYSLEKAGDSEGEEEGSNGQSFKKYTNFDVTCLTGYSYNYSVKCKNNDLIITYDDPTIPKVQKVVQQPGVSKNVIFNGILQGCVRSFNKSTYVIEYKDEASGIIKGKAQYSPQNSWTTYYYLFTFEARDGRYRATFDDLLFTPTPSDKRRNYDKTACDIMYPIFDSIISDLNTGIAESNNAEDW